VSAVNVALVDLCGYSWIHLRPAIKEDSVSRHSGIDMLTAWIHLRPVSGGRCQPSIYLFRCGWIYLRVGNETLFLLLELVKVVQLPHFPPLWLLIMVSIPSHICGLCRRCN
jgi:hypothetical protein